METGNFKDNHIHALNKVTDAVKDKGWFIQPDDSVALESFSTDNSVGLEYFEGIVQANGNVRGQLPGQVGPATYFNPANITIENGVYYATLYVCTLSNDGLLAQRLAIWFANLKETDHVKLSIASRMTNIPLVSLTTILSAIANTKATVEIMLDQIVIDGLAYFYLLAQKVCVRDCGALFIPSYIDNRSEDTSKPWRAVHDFFTWIVENAVTSGRLTHEEGERLNSGQHVIISGSRFSN